MNYSCILQKIILATCWLRVIVTDETRKFCKELLISIEICFVDMVRTWSCQKVTNYHDWDRSWWRIFLIGVNVYWTGSTSSLWKEQSQTKLFEHLTVLWALPMHCWPLFCWADCMFENKRLTSQHRCNVTWYKDIRLTL